LDPFPDLETLSDDEKDALIAGLEREEEAVSYRRRLLHGRIDLLRKEYEERVKLHLAEGRELPELAPSDLERPLFEGTGELPEDEGLEPMPDLTTLDDEALRAMIHELEVAEDDVSLHRREVQGRLDLLRAARRGEELDVESLTRLLSAARARLDDGAA
jgi:hypothetical protein